MCGIIGWLGDPQPDLAEAMRDRLHHRGPDGFGQWYDPEAFVWLGHRRLAILDLSPNGHQPMASASGRYVVTFNGEIFNFPELRDALTAVGYRFIGGSDTEVLVNGFEAWGIRGTVERLVGMFAFGVWDRKESAIWLGRDRLGIKPLYYAQGPGRLAFASELQALRPLPGLDASVDEDALFAYFRYLCVPAPATIVKGVRKLAPGCILRWDPDGATIWRYWDPREVARKGFEEPYSGSFGEAADELESRLKEAIKMRMLSDVPLGAFISGGVDSSTVVALMQAQSTERIKTYTIGFPEATHDESIHAGAVATHLGTDHHTLMLSPGDVLHLVPEIGKYYDEPFADSSNVPTYLLSRFARQDVTVALSGDGGDELFAGYPRYFWGARIEGIRKALSPTGAKYLGRALAGVPAGLWDGPAMRLGGARLAGSEGLSTRVQRLGGYLACSPDRVYEEMLSAWREPGRLIGPRAPSGIGPNLLEVGDLPWPERMMAVDLYNYLVDDILTKVDRASMAVSLEARVPLLDHRFVEWSWRIPRAFKMAPQGDRGKLLLREVLYRHVPRDLIERPKKGFGMPLGPWLRKELKSWALEKLAPEGLEAAGLCPAPVIEAWEAHQRGENRIQQLWTVLTYVQWLERWRDHRAG